VERPPQLRSARTANLPDSDEANGRLEALFVISITLGLRPGELRKLTWNHVDLGPGLLQ
jgi:integrase